MVELKILKRTISSQKPLGRIPSEAEKEVRDAETCKK